MIIRYFFAIIYVRLKRYCLLIKYRRKQKGGIIIKRKISETVFYLFYSFFAVLWSIVLLKALAFEGSTIGVSGISYFERFNITVCFMLILAVLLLLTCIFGVIKALFSLSGKAIRFSLAGLFLLNGICLCLLPPQIYVVSLFSIFRYDIHISEYTLSKISFMLSPLFFFILSTVYAIWTVFADKIASYRKNIIVKEQ